MGFFNLDQTQSKSRPDGKVYSCASCGLYQNCLSPKMKPHGKGRKRILTLGEGPGETEDARGKQWQGKVGRKLSRVLKSLGVDLFEDCWSINAVNCRPPKNRTPTNYEISCCRSSILALIKEKKPHMIIALGNSAVESIIGHSWKQNIGGISKWRGWTIPDREIGAWICPVFHPSFVVRQSGFPEVETIWLQDLKNALMCLDKPFPKHRDERKGVIHVPDREVVPVLKHITSKYTGDVAFIDYETTGLKPHAFGHRIVCTSISPDPHEVYVFMGPKTKRTKGALADFLQSARVGKAASNMKFEHAWGLVRLGAHTQPWVWDTMIAAHVLDNRPGISSIKFQAYVHLGVADYSSHISPFLEGKAPGENPKSENAINRIFELIDQDGGEELRTYCALDSLYEHQVGLIQMKQLGYSPDFYPPF